MIDAASAPPISDHAMSLKGFHILFITLATLCAFGFAMWTFWSRSDANTEIVRSLGVASAASGAALAAYGIWFYRRIRNASLP